MIRPLALSLTLALCLTACASSGDGKKDDHAHDDHAERMAKEHQHDTSAPSPHAEPEPAQPVAAEDVVYAKLGDTSVTGYMARPQSATGPLPAIIVIHEWWGLNDNIRAMTRRLAGEGYLVLAVDLYEGGVGNTPDESMALMKTATSQPDRLKENLKQGISFLKSKQATKLASLGWCFGGGWSFETASSFPQDIDAAVIYYGKVPTTAADVAKIDAPVLGIFGAEDDGIPLTQVQGFERAMAEAGKTLELNIYEGAGHAFANPTGNRYKQDAAEDSWKKTTDFLSRKLR